MTQLGFSKQAFITADENPFARTTSRVYVVEATTVKTCVRIHRIVNAETQPALDDVDPTYFPSKDEMSDDPLGHVYQSILS